MTRPLSVRTILGLLVLLACASVAQAQEPPSVTFELLNPPPPQSLLELSVGESYTAEILVTSDQPFLLAMVLPDQYYPGRGIFVRGGDRVGRVSEAILQVTITGKNSTADLPTICDWPEDGDECWPAGVAPVSLAVGVRFQGGLVIGQRFEFAVSVD